MGKLWTYYFLSTISIIVFSIFAIIQLQRLIRNLKRQYNDWVIITCWYLFLIYFAVSMVIWITLEVESLPAFYVFLLANQIDNVVLYGFEILTAIYPLFLIIYCTKLGHLLKGKSFDKVKAKINRLELTILISVIIFLSLYLISWVITTILLITHNWAEDLNIEEFEDGECKSLSEFNYKIDLYSDWILAGVLSISQLFLYKKLAHIMRNKLHFYYQILKQNIRILFISNIAFLFVRVVYDVIYIIKGSNLFNLKNESNLAEFI